MRGLGALKGKRRRGTLDSLYNRCVINPEGRIEGTERAGGEEKHGLLRVGHVGEAVPGLLGDGNAREDEDRETQTRRGPDED